MCSLHRGNFQKFEGRTVSAGGSKTFPLGGMPLSIPGWPPHVAVSPILLRGLAAMAAHAQRLPVGRIPEQLRVPFMRPDMVKVCRRRSAYGTEGMCRHEHFPRSAIGFVGVQCTIGRRAFLYRLLMPRAVCILRQCPTSRCGTRPHWSRRHYSHPKQKRPPAPGQSPMIVL